MPEPDPAECLVRAEAKMKAATASLKRVYSIFERLKGIEESAHRAVMAHARTDLETARLEMTEALSAYASIKNVAPYQAKKLAIQVEALERTMLEADALDAALSSALGNSIRQSASGDTARRSPRTAN